MTYTARPDAPPRDSCPDVLAALVLYLGRPSQWKVEQCPWCGRQHLHGAKPVGENPRVILGSRVAHCGIGGTYNLVDKDPEGTARILASQRRG